MPRPPQPPPRPKPEPTPRQDAPPVDPNDLDAVWARVLTLAATRRALAAMVAGLSPESIGGGTIRVKTGSLAPALIEPRRAEIEGLISKAVGARTTLTLVAPEPADEAEIPDPAGSNGEQPAPLQPAEDDPLVQAVLEIFGGEIVDVREKPRPKQEDEGGDQ